MWNENFDWNLSSGTALAKPQVTYSIEKTPLNILVQKKFIKFEPSKNLCNSKVKPAMSHSYSLNFVLQRKRENLHDPVKWSFFTVQSIQQNIEWYVSLIYQALVSVKYNSCFNDLYTIVTFRICILSIRDFSSIQRSMDQGLVI